jgi:hypothetical protein
VLVTVGDWAIAGTLFVAGVASGAGAAAGAAAAYATLQETAVIAGAALMLPEHTHPDRAETPIARMPVCWVRICDVCETPLFRLISFWF